ncbi:MAG: circadian clock protein KaiC [Methylocapsa sp.]|nr:circadian clock protein KaiC [Methylocapsa sp.]
MCSTMPKSAGLNLPKTPTGIEGFDEITSGGLPRSRTALVCGGPGCGKTLFAMEFLVRGATHYGEAGVFMAFEETAAELTENVRSLGFDLDSLQARKKLILDFVRVERSEIEETGEYDLDGLFIRLAHAIESIGAKRAVIDTVESLFSGFSNEALLRAELRRLFRWLKDKGVTAIVTGERGERALTRYGLEEYISDCVIFLDQRVEEQVATRRLRIVKYRGTSHFANEYPFVIADDGINLLPITSLGLKHQVLAERVSTGIARLDTMLGGQGFFRGSTVLVSGTAGTGKSSVSAQFVNAACQRGESCLYISFEESPSQIIRNMRSIGLNLEQWIKKGLLRFHAIRATAFGLETHAVSLQRLVNGVKPKIVVVDPVDGLLDAGNRRDASATVTRIMDFLKSRGITVLMSNLTRGAEAPEKTQLDISSLVDTWLLLRDIELGGERNRAMYILKSRGMAHSNQIREFLITGQGIELADVYLGPEGALTGSARLAQEARERAGALARRQDLERKTRERERKRQALEARIMAMRKEFESQDLQLQELIEEEESASGELGRDCERMALSRKADRSGPQNTGEAADE